MLEGYNYKEEHDCCVFKMSGNVQPIVLDI